MTIKLDYEAKLTIDEVLELGLDHVEDPTVVHTLGDDAGTMSDAGTTPTATKVFSGEVTLVAAAATLDLTALPGPSGTTIDMTGLRVQAVKLKTPDSNTAKMKVKEGAATPYNLFGAVTADGDQVTLPPETVYGPFVHKNTTEVVAAGKKNIDFAGVGTEKISVIIAAG